MENDQGKLENITLIRTNDGSMFVGDMVFFENCSPDEIHLNQIAIFTTDEMGNPTFRLDPLSDDVTVFRTQSILSHSLASEYLSGLYKRMIQIWEQKKISDLMPQAMISSSIH